MPLVVINDDNFTEVIEANPKILVDFYADWCGPCKMIAPILEELAEDGHVIGKLNVDENSAIPQQFEVSSIPTLVVFKDGERVNQHIGYAAKPQIEALLK